MEPDTIKKQKTSWHRLLARLLELALSPVNIEVLPDVSVMTNPPEADILLLRRQAAQWTAAQHALLPDGIRDSKASHILIEFKYTESFNEDALAQAIGYNFFYKRAKKLAKKELQTVILSAKTPQPKALKRLDYFKTRTVGVYRSKKPMSAPVLLLSLNDLSNEPHNAWIKCFASKKKVKEETLKQLKTLDLISDELTDFIGGLRAIWSIFSTGGTKMKMNFTPEQVAEFGRDLGDIWLAGLAPSKRLAGLAPSERLAGLAPSERLAGLALHERLGGLKPSELLACVKPEEIENYLKQLKKQAH